LPKGYLLENGYLYFKDATMPKALAEKAGSFFVQLLEVPLQ
jgi:hypothetical protein